MKRHYILFLLIGLMILFALTGCRIREKAGNEKIRDLEFTVLGDENIPEELKQIIEEKKENEFKITYQDSDFLYICVGYGRQNTGGYSITVEDLYLTSNSIYADTNLIGPEPDTKELYGGQERESHSYPYIVLKTEYLEKSVVFD